MVIPDVQRCMVAIHEAGHVIADVLTGTAVDRVVIDPRGVAAETLGQTRVRPGQMTSFVGFALTKLAGNAATEHFAAGAGLPVPDAIRDPACSTDMAKFERQLLDLPPAWREVVRVGLWDLAARVAAHHWAAIERVAVALCESGDLRGDEAAELAGISAVPHASLVNGPYFEVAVDSPALWWRLGDPVASGVATEHVAGLRNLSKVGSPTFGVPSLAINEPDSAVKFPTVNDGLQGVFPEGSFPFTTAATMELLFRYESASLAAPNSMLAVVSSLGGFFSGLQIMLNTSGGFDVTAANNAGGNYSAWTAGFDYRDQQTHHVALVAEAGSAIKIYIDSVDRAATPVTFTGSMASSDKWLAAVGAVDYPPYILSGGQMTVDEFALYTHALSAARITAHRDAAITAWRGDTSGARINRILDAIGWPAADRQIDTGVAVLQSAELGGTALEALQRIAETEQGRLFVTTDGKIRFIARDNLLRAPYTTSQATFGDDGSELEYGDLSYDDSDRTIYNEAQVSRSNGTVQIVRDTTSQSRYLRRTLVLSGLLHQNDSTSRDLASWIVSRYKDPFRRATGVRLEPSAGNETSHFPHALGRELVDRVTVKRRPQNLGPPIEQQVHIEGITHEVTAVEWVTTWDLSPAETQTYWLLGVPGHSEAGVTTRVAF
ncbi:MAG: LamG-like jellyroll fold domain-containing protein [Actinomycetota bacterium]